MIENTSPVPKSLEEKHVAMRQHLKEMAGGEDLRGIEISGAIRMLANYYESATTQHDDFSELSSSRLGILFRLMWEKKCSNLEGINPTQISKFRNVSKNTVSALVRGLEEQGLVERRLDPSDRRRFLIRITPAGEEMVRATGPGRIQFMNQMVAGLTDEEKSQLFALLVKLQHSLLTRGSSEQSVVENDAVEKMHCNLSFKE